MKEIYQDGHIPLSGEGSDDGFSSKKNPPRVHPTRPKRQPPQPPNAAPQAPSQYYPNPYAPYVPVQPVQPPTGANQSPTQNSIPGSVDYSTGTPYGAYPPPYPYYQPMPVYPPQGYVPIQPAPDMTPPKRDVSMGSDPGTRVLFQSADFDTPAERDYTSPVTVQEIGESKPKIIMSEDVSLEEITLDKRAPETVRANVFEGVSVDEMEMSTFELSAMSHKKHVTSKTLRQPEIASSKAKKKKPEQDIEVEEFISLTSLEEELEAPEEKKKGISRGELIRRIVLGISLIAIVIASAMLLNEYRLSRENARLEEELSNMVAEEEETKKPVNSDKDEENTEKPESTTKPLTSEERWEQIRSEYPNVIFPANLQLKYAKLYAQNQDFVGYLSADGVNMNLPVVQTNDDDYYLKKNFYGKATKYGCPFVTHLNNIDPLDQNTVIFGHHMNDGTVFGALDAYKSIDGFKKAPVISFNTMYKDYQWKVIAAFITNADEKDDNGYLFRYYFTSLSTQERFSAYLNELSQRSLYDTGVDVLPTDKLLTLSTCSHEFTDARFVVVARLVREGEIAEVDTSLATVNSNPRYPQAYYSKKGKTNPYKDASRWEVG